MNLKRVCLVVAGVLLLLPSVAQMPERTPENIEKYLPELVGYTPRQLLRMCRIEFYYGSRT